MPDIGVPPITPRFACLGLCPRHVCRCRSAAVVTYFTYLLASGSRVLALAGPAGATVAEPTPRPACGHRTARRRRPPRATPGEHQHDAPPPRTACAQRRQHFTSDGRAGRAARPARGGVSRGQTAQTFVMN